MNAVRRVNIASVDEEYITIIQLSSYRLQMLYTNYFYLVNEVSQGFWELFTAEDPEHSDVHMLPYPVCVDAETGDVTALESPWDCFPDTSANVLGCKSSFLPIKLTT